MTIVADRIHARSRFSLLLVARSLPSHLPLLPEGQSCRGLTLVMSPIASQYAATRHGRVIETLLYHRTISPTK
jgi:hypothetical protein